MNKITVGVTGTFVDSLLKGDPSFVGWYRWNMILKHLNSYVGRNTLYAILRYEKYLDKHNKPIAWRNEKLIFRHVVIGYEESIGKSKYRHMNHTVFFISTDCFGEILTKLGLVSK